MKIHIFSITKSKYIYIIWLNVIVDWGMNWNIGGGLRIIFRSVNIYILFRRGNYGIKLMFGITDWSNKITFWDRFRNNRRPQGLVEDWTKRPTDRQIWCPFRVHCSIVTDREQKLSFDWDRRPLVSLFFHYYWHILIVAYQTKNTGERSHWHLGRQLFI